MHNSNINFSHSGLFSSVGSSSTNPSQTVENEGNTQQLSSIFSNLSVAPNDHNVSDSNMQLAENSGESMRQASALAERSSPSADIGLLQIIPVTVRSGVAGGGRRRNRSTLRRAPRLAALRPPRGHLPYRARKQPVMRNRAIHRALSQAVLKHVRDQVERSLSTQDRLTALIHWKQASNENLEREYRDGMRRAITQCLATGGGLTGNRGVDMLFMNVNSKRDTFAKLIENRFYQQADSLDDYMDPADFDRRVKHAFKPLFLASLVAQRAQVNQMDVENTESAAATV